MAKKKNIRAKYEKSVTNRKAGLYKKALIRYNKVHYTDTREVSCLKNLIAWVIALVLILTIPLTAFAENTEEAAPPPDAEVSAEPTPEPTPVPTETPAETAQKKEEAPEVDMSQIESISAMLIDADTGEVLFSKNADWTIFPASTTKLMTALLVSENCTLDEMVTFTTEIKTEVNKLSTNGSLMHLRNVPVDTQISVKDLMYGLMLCSGNDAAVTLGMHIAGTEQAFVDMMNAKAQELGMTGTHFLNPHGVYIHNVGYDHYSTASDMAKLAAVTYKVPMITEVCNTKTYHYETVSGLCSSETLGEDTIENSNYLLNTPANRPEVGQYFYDKTTGLKTGLLQNILPPGATEYIKNYGCLVASASNDGLNLITVIFGDETKEDKEAGIPGAHARWTIAKYLFDYGFANFAKVNLLQYAPTVALTETIEGAAGNDPENGAVEVKADLSVVQSETQLMDAATVQALKDGTLKLEEKTNITQPLIAPITAGQQVGTVSYLLNGEEIYTAPLIAGRDVFQKGEEEQTSEEYGVPVFTFELWYLWVIIPAAAVLTILLIRLVNLRRRKARYAAPRSAYSAPPQKRKTAGTQGPVQRRTVSTKPPAGRRHKM